MMKKIALTLAFSFLPHFSQASTLTCKIEQDGFLEDFEWAVVDTETLAFDARRNYYDGIQIQEINSTTQLTSFRAKPESCSYTKLSSGNKISAQLSCMNSKENEFPLAPITAKMEIDLSSGTVEYEETMHTRFAIFGRASLYDCKETKISH